MKEEPKRWENIFHYEANRMEGIKCKDCYWCTGIQGVIPFTCERYPECDPCNPEAETCDLFEPDDFK